MAVQKFKNMKDTQDAQIRTRKGKQVLDNSIKLFPSFVPRAIQRSFGRNGGRGDTARGRGESPKNVNQFACLQDDPRDVDIQPATLDVHVPPVPTQQTNEDTLLGIAMMHDEEVEPTLEEIEITEKGGP
ncbi:hypothetical protein U1Q18_005082 [Sarracenia purpurea var. burkii]